MYGKSDKMQLQSSYSAVGRGKEGKGGGELSK